MEVVPLESSVNTSKTPSMEDNAAALQLKGVEMQQKDHTRACFIMSYSTAAREYAKKRLHHHGAVEQERARTQTRTPKRCRGLVKMKRTTVDPASSDAGAGFPTTYTNFLKSEKCLLIHRNFACWGSVPAVHLAIILACMQKIAVGCS